MYVYICNQYLSLQNLWVLALPMARCTQYNRMWKMCWSLAAGREHVITLDFCVGLVMLSGARNAHLSIFLCCVFVVSLHSVSCALCCLFLCVVYFFLFPPLVFDNVYLSTNNIYFHKWFGDRVVLKPNRDSTTHSYRYRY
jgi:hypothetical protein